MKNVVAVQAQDAFAAVLAVWARSDGLTSADVERARADGRTVIRTWLMRGTLHLACADDLGWLLPLVGPRFIHTTRRRYAELGLDESTRRQSLAAIRTILAGRSPMKRSELIARLAERGLPTAGQAAYAQMHHAGLSGLLAFGPDVDGEETLVLLEEWAPLGSALPEGEARAELARRYLRAYAPAGPQDLAAWSGLTVTRSRAVFDALAGQLVEVEFAGQPLWLLSDQVAWLATEPTCGVNVQLLPRYDTYLLGYRDRDLVVPPQFAKRIHPGGGILHPVVLVDGVAAGTWKMARRQGNVVVTVESFAGLSDEAAGRLEREVGRLGRFLETDAKLTLLAA